jgi:hypothetical protein
MAARARCLPYLVTAHTIKKVAATREPKVSLPNFLFWGTIESRGDDWAGALAVANFYGFLLVRLTLTTPSPLLRGSRLQRFRGFGEVSSQHREYGNLDAAQ